MIEGTFYTEETDLFVNRIFESKTYLISKCEVSIANKKFTTIKHDYRLIFKADSVVEEVSQSERPSKVPGVNSPTKLNLACIDDIIARTNENLFFVEVYGRVTNCTPYEDTTVNHGGKSLQGRYQIYLQEIGGVGSLRINMWGFSGHHTIDIIEDDMVLVIGARVTDKFGDSQLNVNPHDGKVVINPSRTEYALPVVPKSHNPKLNEFDEQPAAVNKPAATQTLIRELDEDTKKSLGVYELQC